MNKKVIEYFDTYFSNFGGELNESTSNEQLEEAALDLVNLTEEVLLVVEKLSHREVATKFKQYSATKKADKNLRKNPFFFSFTKKQKQRSKNRAMMMKTKKGEKLLQHLDSDGLKKDKEAAVDALRRTPGAAATTTRNIPAKAAGDDPGHGVTPAHTVTKPAVTQDALKRGKEIGKKRLEKLGSQGRDVHAKVKGPDAPMPSGLRGVKSQAPKDPEKYARAKKTAKYAGIGLGGLALAAPITIGLAHLNKEGVNHDEEEKNNPYQDHEKMRISQKLLNVKRGEDWASREKTTQKQRRAARSGDKKYFNNLVTNIAVAKQPHAQKSLVAVDGGEGKSITDKGRTGVEAETKRAAISAGSLLDIINKNPVLKNRFEKGGTRREREERGQGRFDFRTSTGRDPHSTDRGTSRRTRTEKGSEAKK